MDGVLSETWSRPGFPVRGDGSKDPPQCFTLQDDAGASGCFTTSALVGAHSHHDQWKDLRWVFRPSKPHPYSKRFLVTSQSRGDGPQLPTWFLQVDQ